MRTEFTVTENTWRAVILILSCAVLIVTAYCLSQGITIIFMHLYYLPIVLLAYHYRRTGFWLSVLLSFIYLTMVVTLVPGNPEELGGAVLRALVFIGIAAIVIYLVERRDAEGALRESEERFRKIFETSPIGMALVAPDLRFFSVNPAWIAMTGYSEDELLGLTVWDITHPDYLAGDKEHIHNLIAGTIPVYSTEKKYLRKDKSILWGLLRVTAIRNEVGVFRYLAAQIEDITERKNAEEQREALIRELAQKNAELDRFTYTVSHDLKSPLLAMRAFLSLLEDDIKSGNTGRVTVDIRRMNESAVKLENLISTLLSLSRSGKSVDLPARVPFADLVREAARMLDATIKQRRVTLVISDDLPVVMGDRQRLMQVVTNLLDNAVKFMGDHKEPRVEVGVRGEAGAPVFFVRDNGMGIKEENLAKVFGLFERFNPEVPGTGIGLAIVQRIIEAHGGKVWAESDGEGKGATICFTLPGAAGNAEREIVNEVFPE